MFWAFVGNASTGMSKLLHSAQIATGLWKLHPTRPRDKIYELSKKLPRLCSKFLSLFVKMFPGTLSTLHSTCPDKHFQDFFSIKVCSKLFWIRKETSRFWGNFLAGSSRTHSRCPQKCCDEKNIFWKIIFSAKFPTLSKQIWAFLGEKCCVFGKNCILRVQRYFLTKFKLELFKNVFSSSFFTIWVKFSQTFHWYFGQGCPGCLLTV